MTIGPQREDVLANQKLVLVLTGCRAKMVRNPRKKKYISFFISSENHKNVKVWVLKYFSNKEVNKILRTIKSLNFKSKFRK